MKTLADLQLVPPREATEEGATCRCTYLSARGSRCVRFAVEGESVCVQHGASISVAREQTYRRLLSLQIKAIDVIEDIFSSIHVEDRVRLAASIAVLDRTDLGPKSTVVQVDGSKEELYAMDKSQIEEQLEAFRQRMKIGKRKTSDTTH